MCVYVCICTYMNICVFVYVYLCLCVYTCVCMCVNVSMYICEYLCSSHCEHKGQKHGYNTCFFVIFVVLPYFYTCYIFLNINVYI